VSAEAPALSRFRWLFYLAGTAMIGYGLWGQLFGRDTNPRRYGELLLAAALGHDLLLAPVVLVAGLVVRKLLHRQVRGALQGAAIVGFALVLIAIPGVGRYGARSDNSSILPRDYTTGVLLSLGAVGVGTLLVVLVRWGRDRVPRRR